MAFTAWGAVVAAINRNRANREEAERKAKALPSVPPPSKAELVALIQDQAGLIADKILTGYALLKIEQGKLTLEFKREQSHDRL